ncbi:uncharacterized protein LOC117178635 [Belonocnema kinseyi]|uniref:uncharacterized protein LOC117178635 n=1 Tax=Belonocnema kinseyi TaxID=2817044 RepID=UPI00143D827D|nr:uncharacterized protein LOC117178635 [Belonocnema kinseyi]
MADVKLDRQSRRDWETSLGNSTNPPTFDQLKTFFQTRIRTLEVLDSDAIQTNQSSSQQSSKSQFQKKRFGKFQKSSSSTTANVNAISEQSMKEQAAKEQLTKKPQPRTALFNVVTAVSKSNRASKKLCQICQSKHHTVLHDPSAQISQKKSPLVLLITAMVNVSTSSGHTQCVRAVIDQGSEVSIISESLAQSLQLPRTKGPVVLLGVGETEEEECGNLFQKTHSRTRDGRYVVHLPIKRDVTSLGDSYSEALRMLLHMEQRFKRDVHLQEAYAKFMEEYHQLQHMKSVNIPVDPRSISWSFFLPHHGVWHVLLQWRLHFVVFSADVEKMYQQIIVHQDDQDLQLILWQENQNEPVQVDLRPIKYVITKRLVVSQSAQLIGPVAWLAPVITVAKIFMQELWKLNLSWDDPLPEGARHRWIQYYEDLPRLSAVRIPRWIGFRSRMCSFELHGFADASEKAYGVVVYLKTVSPNGNYFIGLISSKTKVAPVQTVPLPCLELRSSVLLARLVAHLQTQLHFDAALHLWYDSMNTSLDFSCSYKMDDIHRESYFGNSNDRSFSNSRGLSACELSQFSLWWNGPPWLKRPEEWPSSVLGPPEKTVSKEERRVTVNVAVRVNDPCDLLSRYSSLDKLLRVTALCLRFRDALKCRSIIVSRILVASDLRTVLLFSIQQEQNRYFSNEITALKNKVQISKNSTLIKLTPFFDGQLLRVGRRLKHSLLTYDEKHPLILPPESILTTVIIRDIPCVRNRGNTQQQLMSDLSSIRITPPERALMNTGVDYAGPINVRTSKRRGHHSHKAWICIFVCCASRSVHLELVSDYTAEAFIAAYIRFISRRGLCRTLSSDEGTNFVGTDRQLQEMFSEASAKFAAVATYLDSHGTQWKFNPPAVPHCGGLWEAAVKSTKFHLRRVIGDSTLTFEEMTTSIQVNYFIAIHTDW